MGYLVRISFLGYNLKSYPDYHKISYNILSYPIISFHILSYPKISSGANSQMDGSSNEFREVGIESRGPLQSTCAHRSSASCRVRLAVCPAMPQCSACEVENTHCQAEIHYDHVKQISIMRCT